jgi:hypothetical protein
MKRFHSGSLNRKIFLALAAGGLLLLATAIGCGDDDDDGSAGSAATGAAGSTGGTGGGKAGTGGGTGGTDAGTDGTGTPVATDAEKQSVCQCLFDLGTLVMERLIDVCIENITDYCVACMNEIHTGSCVGMETTEFDSCVSTCVGLVPPPETTEECKELVIAGAHTEAESTIGQCMCEQCLEELGACVVNPSCQAVARCAAEQACGGMACLMDPVCQQVIIDQATIYGNVVMLATPMATCADTSGCAAVPDAGAVDGGAADGGAADAG